MTNEFQALIPGKRAQMTASGATSPTGSTTTLPDSSGFQPLLAVSKSVHTGERPNKCNQPEIILQRDGDRVTQIRIQCGCGQIIELGCQY